MAGEAVRVTTAVESLVMIADDAQEVSGGRKRLDEAFTDDRCSRICLSSSAFNGPGLRRIASGTPILPMSWTSPPRYSATRSDS